ncbi:EF hand [Humidesulfovibrio mexicanus]|uniref:EF hand n=2 Tax=Humidesulfovibrio mexicanus TaxID=147047 RepID=A0A238Z0I8_9BACT|nr:EF hand [Humidesulfovibrio mexicanus]
MSAFARCVALACVFLLFGALPGMAQEAPPHEGEGQRRAAPAVKAAEGRPAVRKAPVVRPVQAKPAATAAGSRKQPAGKSAARPEGKRPLRSVDRNHDGRVSREEYLAGSKKRFAKADANRDGVISAQEARAAKAKLEEKRAARDARRKAQGKAVKPQAKGKRPARPYLSALDKNKDGKVSQKEYLARREKQFVEKDLNRDGVISREEARQAVQRAKERREEKKAQAKARRLRRAEEARKRAEAAGLSSPGPELVGTATPPPPPRPGQADSPERPERQDGIAPMDLPLTPIAPGLPATAEPAT